MKTFSFWSGLIITRFSIAFLISLLIDAEEIEFWLFMSFMTFIFLCISILYGNLNALAIEHLGHIAGVDAAVIGSLSSLVSIPIGIVIGQNFDGTVLPLVMGFALCGVAKVLSILWANDGVSESNIIKKH